METTSPVPTIIARTVPPRSHTPVTPLVGGQARLAVAAENDTIEATCELVYQRDDLAEAGSDENNRLLAAALRVAGLPPLARELIQRALHLDHGEDAAVRRAQERRDAAHGFTQSATVRLEELLTGKRLTDDERAEQAAAVVCDLLVGANDDDDEPVELAWPLDGQP